MKNRSKDESFGSKPKEPTRRGKITFSRGDKGQVPYDPKKQDPSWYSRNPQLTKDTTNLSFPFKNGLEYPIANPFSPAGIGRFTVPSVLGYGLAITLGGCKSADSLNTIANNMYSWVRYANSGSRNYEAPDLFMYLGAIVTPYALVSHVTKLIGLTNVASAINRAYPRQVFNVCYVDFDDAIANIAVYRGRLNRLIVRLNAYNVPRQLNVYASSVWGFSGVYLESDNPKDQLYVTFPTYGMEFDATHSNGSALKMTYYNPTVVRTIGDWLDEIERLLRILETDEDIGIMSGDLLKVAGSDNLYQISQVPEDFILYPTYSEDIGFKLKNIRCCPVHSVSGVQVGIDELVGAKDATGFPWDTVSNGCYAYYQTAPGLGLANQVVQSIGLRSQGGNANLDGVVMGFRNLIDTKNVTPTMDEINEDVSVKFTLASTVNTTDITGSHIHEIINFGNFICTHMVMFVVETSTPVFVSNHYIQSYVATDLAITALSPIVDNALMLRNFKFEFSAISTFFNPGGGVQFDNRFIGDFTNVHLLTPDEETAIFDQQLLSMYAIPARDHLGKAISYKG